MGKGEAGVSRHAKGFLIILLVISVWEYFTYAEYISTLAMPRPSRVIWHGLQILKTGKLYQNVLQTLTSWLVALMVGMTIGLLLGFMSGVSKNIESLLLPITAFMRSIPPIAFFPIFLIVIGPGRQSIITIGIAFVAIYVLPIASQSANSAKSKFIELSQILNLSKVEFIQKIIVPATLISSIVASRLAASFLFAITIAGEIMIGSTEGIGVAITEYSQKYMLEEAYFYILLAGMLGLSIDLILSYVQSINEKKMLI